MGGYEGIQFAIQNRIEVVQRLRHAADTDRYLVVYRWNRYSCFSNIMQLGAAFRAEHP